MITEYRKQHFADFTISVDINGDSSGLEHAAQEGGKSLDGIGKSGKQVSGEIKSAFEDVGKTLKALGDSFTAAGKVMSVAVTTPLAAAGRSAILTSADFEKAMSQVAASMGVTTDELSETQVKTADFTGTLEEFARKLGRDTAFSAQEAADGLNILAQAGYDVQDQVEILPSVLDLAAAGSIGLAESAAYVTGAINGFNDASKSSRDYADMIAKGATLAKTDVAALGAAMSTASSSAAAYGQSAEETEVALLRLAQQNVTGAEAATMLNRTMTDLYAPTETAAAKLSDLGVSAYDANGKARDLGDVMADLEAATAGMSDEQKNAALNTIFTTHGLQGFNKMCAASTEDVDKFRAGMEDFSGSAAQQAATMLDNLEGKMTLLNSAIDDVKITVGQKLYPIAEGLIGKVTDLINWFNNLSDEGKDQVIMLAGIAAAIGPLLLGLGGIMKFGSKVTGALDALSGAFGVTSSAILLPIAAIGLLIAAFMYLWTTNEDFRAGIIEIWNGLVQDFQEFVNGIKQRLSDAGLTPETLKEAWADFCEFIEPVFTNAFRFIADFLSGIFDVTLDVLDNFIRVFQAAWEEFGPRIAEAWEQVTSVFEDFIGGLQDVLDNNGISADGIKQTIEDLITWVSDQWVAFIQIFGPAFSAFWDVITGVASFALDLILSLLDFFIKTFQGIWETIGPVLTQAWEGLKDVFGGFFDALAERTGQASADTGGFFEALGGFLEWLTNAITGFVIFFGPILASVLETVTNAIGDILEVVLGFVDIVIGILEGDWSQVWTGAGEIVSGVFSFIDDIISGFIDMIGTVFPGLADFLSAIWDGIKDYVQFTWDTIIAIVEPIVNLLKDLITGDMDAAKQDVSDILDGILGLFQSIWQTIVDTVGGFLGNIVDSVSEKIGSVAETVKSGFQEAIDFITGLPGQAWQWGADIIGSIADGIWDCIGQVTSAVSSVADTIKGYLGFSEPEIGPLSDFHTYMPDMISLMTSGMSAGINKVGQAAEGLAGSIFSGFSPAGTSQAGAYAGSYGGPVTNMGGVTMIVNSQPGQDVSQLADLVAERILERARV